MLKLSHIPRLTWDYLLMAGSDQKQVRHPRDAKRLLYPIFLSAHLVLVQFQVAIRFAIDLFYWTGR